MNSAFRTFLLWSLMKPQLPERKHQLELDDVRQALDIRRLEEVNAEKDTLFPLYLSVDFVQRRLYVVKTEIDGLSVSDSKRAPSVLTVDVERK